MCILVSRVQVQWDEAFQGFLPSKTLFKHGGLYTCAKLFGSSLVFRLMSQIVLAVGILGATVMPHGLFLGSALATQDRASVKPTAPPSPSSTRVTSPKGFEFLGTLSRLLRPIHADTLEEFASHADRPNNSLAFVKAHLKHGIVDLVINLLGLAVIINSL
jgi:metal iron transporter